ncbi:MAG TPA: dihydrolipoyl dehydrogenase [Methanosarcinales archaeon]|nr:dihydrolipoyl dehydrogenase [Methanosarcinales archaeon]
METKNTDLAVLGGGPGGYVAAIRAAKLGVKTMVIEKENLGGVCLNWGCIPTKALYHVAQTIDEIKKADIFGINISGWNLDFKKAMDRKDKVIAAQRQGLAFHFKKNNVELVKGNGKLISSNKILVTGENGQEVEVIAKNIIIATGSHAANVPPFNLEDEGVIDNIGILSLTAIPESLLIVGGGVIGSEFANIFSTFGSSVTIVEMLPRILSTEDVEVSKVIAKAFGKKGINVFTNSVIEEVKKDKGKFFCKIKGGDEIVADKVLISVGRRPNSTGIGLEEIGVTIDERGFIKADSHLRTNIPNIYAVGDVNGGLQLAHVASDEGKIAAENIAGKDKTMDYRVIPWAVFTSPEIGTVGLNEEQARSKGINVCFGLFPFSNSGKAFITGETEGFVKVVTDKDSGEILGAQMVGPRCSDLVHEVAVAMKGEMVVDTLAETVHSHPTLSEAVMEAAEDCFGIATHITR